MKNIPLRTLIRTPLKVKRMTHSGQSVKVTDNGEPLWILQPASEAVGKEAERRLAIDLVFTEVLGEKLSSVSAARLLEKSRR